jgi:hypothetical protein
VNEVHEMADGGARLSQVQEAVDNRRPAGNGHRVDLEIHGMATNARLMVRRLILKPRHRADFSDHLECFKQANVQFHKQCLLQS